MFRKALESFVPACDRYAADSTAKWPAALQVKDVEGAPGVWEMTWSFTGPDGRATFGFVRIDGSLGVRWRRVGDHSIFTRPWRFDLADDALALLPVVAAAEHGGGRTRRRSNTAAVRLGGGPPRRRSASETHVVHQFGPVAGGSPRESGNSGVPPAASSPI